jgi:hypothetical protein
LQKTNGAKKRPTCSAFYAGVIHYWAEGSFIEMVLRKHGDSLFLVFVVIAFVPMYLYELEFNQPFIFAFKYLTIPVFAITFYVFWYKMPKWRREVGALKGVAMTFLVAASITLMSGAYVIGANAWVGQQKNIRISGEITKLDTVRGSRTTSYQVTVTNIENGQVKKLDVNERVYLKLKLGDAYSEPWVVGSLDLIYRRK